MTIQLFPLETSAKIRRNLLPAELVELAIKRGEGRLASTGAFVVETGQHTGRSAEDKYVVRDAETDAKIWWDNSKAMTEEQFDRLLADFIGFAKHKELFVQDLFAGADPRHRPNCRIVTEYSWHALFIRHLLRRPELAELASFVPEFTVVDLPSFRAAPLYHGTRSETVIACNFTKRIVLIGGTSYAGEIKKSVFSFLNYILPAKGVMPMHCSANVGNDGSSAVFFGLSGTGKTTLSADPARELLGDDEHGWSEKGIFNFEGGCYAKTIRLSKTAEPEIYAASNRFATVLENVVIDPKTRVPDFDDGRLADVVKRAIGEAAIGIDRGDVDDLAAGFFQFRNGITAGEEGAFQIDIDGAVPLGLGHCRTFAFHPDARRIDEEIEPAEARNGFENHVGAIGNFRDVTLDGKKLRRQVFDADIGNGEICARLFKFRCRGAAHAAAAADNKNGFAGPIVSNSHRLLP